MNNAFIVDNLLKQTEGERLAFMRDARVDDVAICVTAMLNTDGGDILIGVADNKQLIGISDEFDFKELQQTLNELVKPLSPIDVTMVEYKGVNLCLVSVWRGSQMPYHYKGTIYIRSITENIIATSKELMNVFSIRKSMDLSWERTPVLGADIDDLDLNEVQKTISLYNKMGSDIIQDEEDFLSRNGLLRNGNLTNACVLLYAKSPIKYIAQAGIRLAVYASESNADLIDTRFFNGNIFKNIDGIFQFLDMTYTKRVKVDDLLRTEQWDYPRVAVREGIMNAIVHRDYNAISGLLNIQVYPNRLEIISYGSLLQSMSFEDLAAKGYSMLRNPDIARQCYYRKLIEMMGTGISRMIQDCKNQGFPIPIFDIHDNIIKVTFDNINSRRNSVKDSAIETHIDLKARFEGVVEGVIEGISIDVREKLVQVMSALNDSPGQRTTAIETTTGIPVKSLERYVKILRDYGLVEYRGPNKTGGYYLTLRALEE